MLYPIRYAPPLGPNLLYTNVIKFQEFNVNSGPLKDSTPPPGQLSCGVANITRPLHLIYIFTPAPPQVESFLPNIEIGEAPLDGNDVGLIQKHIEKLFRF